MAKKEESNKDEQVGFHKGALATLAKEREEMLKILQIVEQLMQMHIKGLKDLGVDLEEAAKAAKNSAAKADASYLHSASSKRPPTARNLNAANTLFIALVFAQRKASVNNAGT